MVEAIDAVPLEVHRASQAAGRGRALQQRHAGAALREAQREHGAEDAGPDDADARWGPSARWSGALCRGRGIHSSPARGEIGGGWMRPTRCAAIRRPYASTVGRRLILEEPMRRDQSLTVGTSATLAPAL